MPPTAPTTILWTSRLTALGFGTGVLLCLPLWTPAREYPLVPVWPGWRIPEPFHVLLLVGLLLSLGLTAVLPRPRWAIGATLACAVLLAAADQTRWQPWVYQYAALLAACGWGLSNGKRPERPDHAATACRLIVAGVYFYSGAQKFHAGFVENVYPWLVMPVVDVDAAGWTPSGWAVPVVEMLAGAGLMLPAARRPAAVVIWAMHVFIMACIGPLGHNWNSVVWPWNVAMPAIVWVLFWRRDEVAERAQSAPRSGRERWIVLVTAALLFWLLPALSFFDRWDAYLSASLYSGSTLKAHLEFSRGAFARLPKPAASQCEAMGGGRQGLYLNEWSQYELNVPPYPARRVFVHIAEEASRRYGRQPGDVVLFIVERPNWFTGEAAVETRYPSLNRDP